MSDTIEELSKLDKSELIEKILEQNNQFESLKKEYESLTKKNESQEKEYESLEKTKEVLKKQIMNEKVPIVNKDVYENFDKQQKDKESDIEMKVLKETNYYEENFNQFKKYVSNIDIISSNNNKKNDNEELKNIFLEKNEINSIINHKFGDNLSIKEFLNAFDKAIKNNINKNWELNERLSLKQNIEIIYDKEMKQLFYEEIPNHIIQLKLDMLLNIVLCKKYIEKDFNANFVTLKTENYSLLPLKTGIQFTSPYDNTTYIFNKDYIIKKIINNAGILNAYFKTIQKFITNKFDKNNLKNRISNIVNKTNIYFCDLPKFYRGVTICNGDIFISGKYLQESLKIINDNYYNFTAISKIYLTLLHEFANKILYTLSSEFKSENESNYFIKAFLFKEDQDFNFDLIEDININKTNEDYYEINKTKLINYDDKDIESTTEYKNLHRIPTECDSGKFFDDELYLGKKQLSVTKKISEFFLLYTCPSYKHYIIIMKNLLEDIEGEIESNSNYKLFDEEEDIFICYHSYVRNLKKNYNE